MSIQEPNDQYVSSYDRQHRSYSWKHQCYFTAFKIIETTAFSIYKEASIVNNFSSKTHLLFKQNVAIHLLTRRTSRDIDSTSSVPEQFIPSSVIDTILHRRTKLTANKGTCQFMIRNNNITARRDHKFKKCGKRTTYGCADCIVENNNDMYLCEVHQEIHERENQ